MHSIDKLMLGSLAATVDSIIRHEQYLTDHQIAQIRQHYNALLQIQGHLISGTSPDNPEDHPS